jgi:glutathione S-transferase
MALQFGEVPYRDEFYTLVQHEGKWRSSWPPKAKELLNSGCSAFPNLPYLSLPAAAGGGVLMQSNAILRHVARVTGLNGSTEVEVMKVDELLEQTTDLRNEMVRLNYGADFNEKREAFCKESLPYYFGAFERWLANRQLAAEGELYFVGNSPTVADFAIYDALDVAAVLMMPYIDSGVQYPLLSRHKNTVRSLEKLRGYFDGPLAALPMNNKVASWGGASPESNL